MKTFDVEVNVSGIAYYTVKAESEDEAMSKWHNGQLESFEVLSGFSVGAIEDRFADDEESWVEDDDL